MDLNEQVDLIQEHWCLLLEASGRSGTPRHTLLNILALDLAKVLAEQPAHVVNEWVIELVDHVGQLRHRKSKEIDR